MLTPKQYEFYQQEGYLLVPDMFSTSQLSAALEAAEVNAYGKSFSEFNAEMKANPDLENELSLPEEVSVLAAPKRSSVIFQQG